MNTQDYVRYLRNRYGSYEYADFTRFAQDFSGNTTGERRWQTYSQRFGNEIYDETMRDYDGFADDQFRREFAGDPELRDALRVLVAAAADAGQPGLSAERADSLGRRRISRRASALRWRSTGRATCCARGTGSFTRATTAG